MLTFILMAAVALLPVIVYLLRDAKTKTPSLQWPALAPILKFKYLDKPPRLLGDWEGRHVAVELNGEKVAVTMQLAQPSRLRVEVGDKDVVAKRSGMIVPDPVSTSDLAFEARLLARCSDRAAGQTIFEPALRQRLLQQPVVDMLGVGDKLQWTVPEAREAETVERLLEVMAAIASEMERFPANA